jgi:hypothetical protein
MVTALSRPFCYTSSAPAAQLQWDAFLIVQTVLAR